MSDIVPRPRSTADPYGLTPEQVSFYRWPGDVPEPFTDLPQGVAAKVEAFEALRGPATVVAVEGAALGHRLVRPGAWQLSHMDITPRAIKADTAIGDRQVEALHKTLGCMGMATFADILALGGNGLFDELSRLRRNNMALDIGHIYHFVRAATGRRLPDQPANGSELRWYYSDPATQLSLGVAVGRPGLPRYADLKFPDRPLRTFQDWLDDQDALSFRVRSLGDMAGYKARMWPYTVVAALAATRLLGHDGPLPDYTPAERDAESLVTPLPAEALQAAPFDVWHFQQSHMQAAEGGQVFHILRRLGLRTWSDIMLLGSEKMVAQSASNTSRTSHLQRNSLGQKRIATIAHVVRRHTGHDLPAGPTSPQAARRYVSDVRQVPIALVIGEGSYTELRHYTETDALRTVGGWLDMTLYGAIWRHLNRLGVPQSILSECAQIRSRARTYVQAFEATGEWLR